MRIRIDTENVLFGVFALLLAGVSVAMAGILWSGEEHPPEKTVHIFIPATTDYIELNRRLAEAYEKLHPDIHVEASVFPWRTLGQKMETMIAAGRPPDVIGVGGSQLQRLIYLKAVEPLDEWIRNDPGFDPGDFFPECMSDANWDGVQYGIPQSFSTVCLWYNRTLFDKEGLAYPNNAWTWDDLVAAARKLTKDFDGDGLIDQYGFQNNNYHWNRMPMWVWMNGGEFMTPDQRRATFDSPAVISGLKWLAGLSLREKVSPSYALLRSVGPTNLFLSGTVAMTTETRYFLPQFAIGKNQDKIAGFDWDVCELPRGVRRASTFVIGNNAIPACLSPQRKRLAWDYIKFLSSVEGQRVLAGFNTALPVRRDIAEELVNHPGTPPFNDHAFIDSLPYMKFFYWPFPTDRLFDEINSDFAGIWNGVLEPEDVCGSATVAIDKALDEWYERHPGEKLPTHTKWVPLRERPAAVAAGGQP